MKEPKVVIGICVYNEERDIGRLLKNLLTDQKLPQDSKIIVVCSGCTDNSPKIVEDFCRKDSRIKLINEDERKGKAHALNILFKEASKFDVLVLVNADNIPAPHSINKLIQPFRNENVGATTAHPIPLNNLQNGLANKIVHLIWNLHHKISLFGSVKITGELCAIRPSLVEKIPDTLATDEPYMQLLIQRRGYKVIYVPDAVTYMKGPCVLSELLEQRRRIWTGHLQIKRMTGFIPPTSKLREILRAIPRVLNPLNVERLATVLLGTLLEIYAYLLARYDLSKARIPYRWKRLKSTKNLGMCRIAR